MTDLSFLAVLRNESCMFCAGLLSIGHSLLQIEQPVKPEYPHPRSEAGNPCPAGEAMRLPDKPLRYGLRDAISTWMPRERPEFLGRHRFCPFRENIPTKEGEPE